MKYERRQKYKKGDKKSNKKIDSVKNLGKLRDSLIITSCLLQVFVFD